MSTAQDLYDRGNFRAAAKLYKSEILANPKNAIAHQGLAKSLGQLGQFPESWVEANLALEIDANLVVPYLVKCSVLVHQRKYAEAEEEARKAIKLDENKANAYIGLGVALIPQNKNEEALLAAKKATELALNDWTTHYNCSGFLYKLKQFPDSYKEARLSFNLHPTFQTAIWLFQIYFWKYRFWSLLLMFVLMLLSLAIHNIYSGLMIFFVLITLALFNIWQIRYGQKTRGYMGLAFAVLALFSWAVFYYWAR